MSSSMSNNEDDASSMGSNSSESSVSIDPYPVLNQGETAQKVHDLAKEVYETQRLIRQLQRKLDTAQHKERLLLKDMEVYGQRFAETAASEYDAQASSPKLGERVVVTLELGLQRLGRILYKRLDGKYCVLIINPMGTEVVARNKIHRYQESNPVVL